MSKLEIKEGWTPLLLVYAGQRLDSRSKLYHAYYVVDSRLSTKHTGESRGYDKPLWPAFQYIGQIFQAQEKDGTINRITSDTAVGSYDNPEDISYWRLETELAKEKTKALKQVKEANDSIIKEKCEPLKRLMQYRTPMEKSIILAKIVKELYS